MVDLMGKGAVHAVRRQLVYAIHWCEQLKERRRDRWKIDNDAANGKAR
jgi:hypothetical protein